MGTKQYSTVVDPDAEAYDKAMAQQAAINAAREDQLRRKSVDANKRARTGSLAGDVLSAAEIGAGGVVAASRDIDAVKSIRTLGKFTGPVGHLLSALSDHEAFETDRANGMPLDEAIIKHGGGWILGAAGGVLGAAGGGALGGLAGPEAIPFGASAGAAAGAKLGEAQGERLRRSEASLKAQAIESTRFLTDPSTYINRRIRGW